VTGAVFERVAPSWASRLDRSGLVQKAAALAYHPGVSTALVVLFAVSGLVGILLIEKTGAREGQIVATIIGLALFAALYVNANEQRAGVLVLFLFAWALFAVAGFTARTDNLMGSDVHREFRAVVHFGDAYHWDPLDLPEISFSSVWLIVGTRMFTGLTGLDAHTILKYAYPAMLAAVSIPLFLVFERAVNPRRAFAAVFIAVSALSFWESTAQIAKASISMLIALALLYVVTSRPLSETRTLVLGATLVVALVFTHYTTSVLVLLTLGVAWAAEWAYFWKWRRAGLVTTVPSFRLGLLLLVGCVIFVAWYAAIPYVFDMLVNSATYPIEAIARKLAGEDFRRSGETLAETLGRGGSLGYWSIRISLLVVASAIAAGWIRQALDIYRGRRVASGRLRLFATQTVALGLTAVGFLVPTTLDANRLFAIALVLSASLATLWWGVSGPMKRSRNREAAWASKALLAGSVLVAASQMGLPFLALDGVAFSTNMGDDGPVFARYGFDEEDRAFRDWSIVAAAGRDFRVTRAFVDYFHQDPKVAIDHVRTLDRQAVADRLPSELIEQGPRGILCLRDPGAAWTVAEPRVVYASARNQVVLEC